MSDISYEQVADMAAKIARLAAAFNPPASAALLALIQISNQLNAVLTSIRANDPELWAKVSADYADAVSQWQAAVDRQQGQQPPSI